MCLEAMAPDSTALHIVPSARVKDPQAPFLTTRVLLVKLLSGFRIPLGTRILDSRFPGAHSTGAASTNIRPPTKDRRWVQAWGLEHRTPVTRRPLTECLAAEGGSCLGEKVFVLKFSE